MHAIQLHVSQNLPCCQTAITLLQCTSISSKTNETKKSKRAGHNTGFSNTFPPKPVSDTLMRSIAEGYCSELDPVNILEAGCAVCGCLAPLQKMQDLS
ncbi:hypothetical protein DENSPDRAFT_788533, partial [Dentipellis sp. KUC8613]